MTAGSKTFSYSRLNILRFRGGTCRLRGGQVRPLNDHRFSHIFLSVRRFLSSTSFLFRRLRVCRRLLLLRGLRLWLRLRLWRPHGLRLRSRTALRLASIHLRTNLRWLRRNHARLRGELILRRLCLSSLLRRRLWPKHLLLLRVSGRALLRSQRIALPPLLALRLHLLLGRSPLLLL
jgi:hypothetical protein